MKTRFAWISLSLVLHCPLLAVFMYSILRTYRYEIRGAIVDPHDVARPLYAACCALAATLLEPYWGKRLLRVGIVAGVGGLLRDVFDPIMIAAVIMTTALVAVGASDVLGHVLWRQCLYRLLRGAIAVSVFMAVLQLPLSNGTCQAAGGDITGAFFPFFSMTYLPLLAMVLVDVLARHCIRPG